MRVNPLSHDSFVIILLLIFLYFSYFSSFLGVDLVVSENIQVLSLVLLLLTISLKVSRKKMKDRLSLLLICIVLLISYLTVIININFEFDLFKTLKFFLVFFSCGYIGVYLATSIDIKKLTFGLFFLSSVFVMLSLFFGDVSSSGTSRVVLGDTNPIWNARLLGISLIYSLIQLMIFKRKKIIYLLLTLCTGYAILRTGSRGPIFGIITAFFLIYICFEFNNRKKILFFLTTTSLFLMSYFYVLQYTNILDRFEWLDISSGRTELYGLSINIFISNPLGIGLGGFDRFLNIPGLSYPHNILLEALVETGFLFTLIFFYIIFLSIKRSIKITKYNFNTIVFIFSLFIYSLVNSMFSGDLTSPKELYILTFFFLFYLNGNNKANHKND